MAKTKLNWLSKILLLLIVNLVYSKLNAQEINISGRVNNLYGDAIPGVNIIIKGTTTGAITDLEGFYSIPKVPEDAILIFSFIGMKEQEVSVSGRSTINVVLEQDAIGLNEVVAIGYGSRKRASITGSVATINADKLVVAPVASTSNALAGRLPGLITKQESGLPGADNSTLSIRGFGSPLVIVDGIEADFNNIDANEIESISVLKDASAAIYGARAGNGVILVTTKRGQSKKPTITYNASTTFQTRSNMLTMASSGQNAELLREEHLQAGKPEFTTRFTEEEVQLFYDGTNPDYANTDWLEVVTRKWTPQQQHNISVRGGSDKIKYYGFLGFLDQKSMFKNNGGEYQRYNLRSNIDAQITDNLSLQLDLSSIVENRDFPWRADERENSVWSDYWNTEPYYPSTLPDSSKISYANGGGTGGIHVITNSEISGYKRTESQNLTGTISLKYKFEQIQGLSAKAFTNYRQDYNFFKTFERLVETWTYEHTSGIYTSKGGASNPTLTHRNTNSRVITGQFSTNYDRVFGDKHRVSALALYEIIDYRSNWISAGRDDFMTASMDYLFAGSIANQTSNGSAWEMGRQSYIGRLNYSYNEKYLVEGTLRSDKSAKFSKENRRGIFPSVSLGWRISEENFIKNNVSFIESLKLRGGLSQTGNDAVGNFQYLSGYQLGSQYGSIYMFGDTPYTGIIETGIANPLLTWEKMQIYNIGLDFSLTNRTLYSEFDLFYRERDGIPGIRSTSLPSTFGASLPVENLNKLSDRGFEFMLGHQGSFKEFKWNLSANIAWSRARWERFDEPKYEDADEARLYGRTGEWTDITFGYESNGLFVSQEEINNLLFVYNETQGNISLNEGDIRYIDTNNDGLLNWRDQVEIGKGSTPHWTGGFDISLKFKDFDFSTLLQGAFGFYNYITLKRGLTFPELMYDERWTYENNDRNAIVPRLGGANSNNYPSDYRYIAADYIRVKSLSLGYNLPKQLMTKIKVQNFRIYLAGTNLLTFSKLNRYGIDPEAPTGYAGAYYPQMKTLTFGLNISL